jgi:hypothetical protein
MAAPASTVAAPFSVWVPGALENPLNGSHGHWAKHATWARRRKQAAEMCILHALGSRSTPWPARVPKRITFTAAVYNEFDTDGLAAALKPTRDALKSMQLIDDDRPSSGHVFTYAQVVKRGKDAPRGVQITVEPRGGLT